MWQRQTWCNLRDKFILLSYGAVEEEWAQNREQPAAVHLNALLSSDLPISQYAAMWSMLIRKYKRQTLFIVCLPFAVYVLFLVNCPYLILSLKPIVVDNPFVSFLHFMPLICNMPSTQNWYKMQLGKHMSAVLLQNIHWLWSHTQS